MSRRRLAILVPLTLCVAVFLMCWLRARPQLPATELFRKYILDPVPTSVTEIQVDQPREIGSCVYVFRFGVSRVDFDLIAKSRAFKEAEISVYPDGDLDWTWEDPPVSGNSKLLGSGFHMCDPRWHGPSWFDLRSWNRPESYAYQKEGRHEQSQVLIYNSVLGKAYFIIHILDDGRVAYPNGILPEPRARCGVQLHPYNGEPDPEIIARLNRLIQGGPFEVHIARTFPLARAADAHRALGSHHLGKCALGSRFSP
jgi:hypothetical protein